jgi:hypothetical protein
LLVKGTRSFHDLIKAKYTEDEHLKVNEFVVYTISLLEEKVAGVVKKGNKKGDESSLIQVEESERIEEENKELEQAV